MKSPASSSAPWVQLQVAQQRLYGCGKYREPLWACGTPSPAVHAPALTLLRHIQGLHGWLHWEHLLMAWAPGCVWTLGLARIPGTAQLLAPASTLPCSCHPPALGAAGHKSSEEHTLHKPLHSEEIHGVGVYVSA